MACNDLDRLRGAILRGRVDPCPMRPGFASSDYRREVENTRVRKIHNVVVTSKPLYGYTDIDGGIVSIKQYGVIKDSGGIKPFTHKLTANTGSNGQTEEVSTTVSFNDELLPNTPENLKILCDFGIP